MEEFPRKIKFLIYTFIILTLTILTLLFIYMNNNYNLIITLNKFTDISILGNLGSFLGGILGPIISIISVVFYYNALSLQRVELKSQHRAIDIQNKSLISQTEELVLQRSELALQREEFKLQREEMEKSTYALRQQSEYNSYLKWKVDFDESFTFLFNFLYKEYTIYKIEPSKISDYGFKTSHYYTLVLKQERIYNYIKWEAKESTEPFPLERIFTNVPNTDINMNNKFKADSIMDLISYSPKFESNLTKNNINSKTLVIYHNLIIGLLEEGQKYENNILFIIIYARVISLDLFNYLKNSEYSITISEILSTKIIYNIIEYYDDEVLDSLPNEYSKYDLQHS